MLGQDSLTNTWSSLTPTLNLVTLNPKPRTGGPAMVSGVPWLTWTGYETQIQATSEAIEDLCAERHHFAGMSDTRVKLQLYTW